jgi:aryl-alcohol dehydrogenase-like predicted oxidoreductase
VELIQAVHDNLRNLGIEVLEVVNLRLMFGVHAPAEGSLEAPLTVLAELRQRGLIRHIGLSNVTPTQVREARRLCEIVCVQNHYNLVHRGAMRGSTISLAMALRMCRSSHSVASARCNPRSWRR